MIPALLTITGLVWGVALVLAWSLARAAARPVPEPPAVLREAEAVAAGAWPTERGA